jgi:hypothetical protein
MARSHLRIRTYPRRLTENTLHRNSQATHHHHNKNNKSNNNKRRYDRMLAPAMPTQVGRTHREVTLALPRDTYHPYNAPISSLPAISHLTPGRT